MHDGDGDRARREFRAAAGGGARESLEVRRCFFDRAEAECRASFANLLVRGRPPMLGEPLQRGHPRPLGQRRRSKSPRQVSSLEDVVHASGIVTGKPPMDEERELSKCPMRRRPAAVKRVIRRRIRLLASAPKPKKTKWLDCPGVEDTMVFTR